MMNRDTRLPGYLTFFRTAFAVFLGLGLLTQHPSRVLGQDANSALSSSKYYGAMKAGPRQFRFLIELNESDGSGKLISLDEGKREFPLEGVTLNDDKLRFELKVSKATYEGELTKSGQYEGWWKQSGGSFALNFRPVSAMPEFEYTAIWEGQINLVVQKLNLRVRELKSGEVYLDSVTQLAGGFVAKKEVEGDQITIEVPSLGAKFTGTLNESQDAIEGTWKQGFVSVSLVLKKASLEESLESEAPDRPQTPKAPFPYSVEEVDIPNAQAGVRLAGTLTIPKNESKPGVAILISGSGPQDRDESLMNHKPFWVIADHLSRNGIAVLRFDDRGVGKSTGDFSKATTLDFVSDVEAVVKFLKEDTRLDSQKIGLVGHSEGGIIAPLVAEKDSDVRFIVMLAGPGVNGKEISVDQADAILRASGVSGENRDRQRKIQAILLRLAEQKPALSEEDYKSQALAEIEPLLTDNEKSKNAGKEMVDVAVAQVLTPWFNFFLTHEPAPVLEKLTCSVLALNGEKDLQVTPELNIPAIQKALEKAPTKDFEVIELDGLNHLFQKCRTGLVTEYGELTETFNSAALDKMSAWIKERTK